MEQVKEVSAKIKYFTLSEKRGDMDFNWECTALPFDRDLMPSKRDETNRLQSINVNNIVEGMTAK